MCTTLESLAPSPRKYRNPLHKFLTQLFCNHDYELVDKLEKFPLPKEGERLLFVRKHICLKCSKETSLGSGWIV
ncbi:MAG: hypothetical protein JWM92_473 [Candidatus Nomurabacteria bacterium]|jgi:hypothetical protein|nr:hypothetical protein [Candidatus Nomurabacteria bacterium]